MKLFIKILLFVLVTLVISANVISATIAFPNVQLKATSLYFHKETPKIVFKAVENDLVNYCQIVQNLLDYRNRGEVIEVVAAKTSTNFLSKGDLLRIENAATRINKPITVVGSRADGTVGEYSDWDYVIPAFRDALR